MNTKELETIMQEALYEVMEIDTPSCRTTIKDIRTFEDCGMMTSDKGIVIEFEDGSRNIVTIQ